MRIVEIRTISGPNIYSYRPVLVMKLDLQELNEQESIQREGFNERLLEIVPGLRTHVCSKGYEGGFVERLKEGTYFGHVVEHVALELTELAGVPTYHGKTRQTAQPGVYNVVIEYKAELGTKHLLRTAVALVDAILRGEDFPLDEEIAEVRRIIARTELCPATRTVVEAAERRGIPWQRLDDGSLVQLGYGKNRKLIAAAKTSQTSAIGSDIAADKDLTKRLLNRAGLPFPQGEIVDSEEDAIKVLDWLHKPVTIKPFNGNPGKGVSLNLYTADQVAEAFRIASEYSKDVLIEELFAGRDYRVLVVGGKLVAASERIPATVIGDEVHNVAELIRIENQNPWRGEGHDYPLTKIEIDEAMIAHLHKSELGLQYVPAKGERVTLSENADLSKGGTAKDVTDIVHPSVRRACERAAQIIGLDVCGIDLVLPDIAQAIPKGGAGIIEINAAPDLRMHLFPGEGESRDVGAAILQNLYPFGSSARIPIISITGTNGKTTISRLVAHLLGTTGQRIGLTTTDGIYLNGELIVAGDTTGPRSAQVILSDPTVEAAVLEVARGGIVRGGLGYDWSDISIISNIQADHIGQDDIKSVDDILFIKSLVAERVKEGGTLILNADDERLAHLMEIPRVNRVQKRVIYYSLDSQNQVIRQHEERGGTSYYFNDGWIVELSGGLETQVVNVASVPLTFGGISTYQISNVMAAVAAARASGRPIEIIAEALTNYDAHNNSGRGNLYHVGNGYVLVDYGHNPEAFRAIGRSLKRLPKARVTAVIGVPGDRSDEVIKQSGRAAAEYFDRLMIKEDKDLRGRKSGEVPEMLQAAATEANPNIQCRIVLDEQEALELAINELQKDEIIVIFYEKLQPVTEVLERHSAIPDAGQASSRATGKRA